MPGLSSGRTWALPARLLFILAALLALPALTACRPAPPLVQQEAFVFGTRVEVIVAGQPEAEARAATGAVLREFDRLHRSYHAWQPSELSTLNAALAAGKSAEVSEELAAWLREAQALSAAGDGLFDPGIGRLIALWGFQNDEYPAQLPDPAALAAWRATPAGIADLRLDGRRVSSRSPQVAIDFGGYLKGVALDRAAAILRAHGVGNALINIGGNVMALGRKNGEPWRVGIQHPRQPGALATLELADGEAVGTSGDYQRYFEVGGQRYSHLIDPRSGEPAQHTRALTALIPGGAQAGMRSDALSKPLFIAGASWPALAERLGVTHVLRVDADGRLEISAALNARLKFVATPEPAPRIVP